MPVNATAFVFGEGLTDKIVFDFLRESFFSLNVGRLQPFVVVGGKNNFRSKIQQKVQPDIEARRQDVFILVFRDRDVGEKAEQILQSFKYIVRELLSPWDATLPSEQKISESIYKWDVLPAMPVHPGFRFVLHIANNERLSLPMTLRNHTTDGYVLASGLLDPVLNRFAEEVKFVKEVSEPREVLYKLITQSIPTTMQGEGVEFSEDKDFLAAYLVATRFWVVKRTEEQSRLVRTILDRAMMYDPQGIERVFESWLQAIREVLQ